MTFTLCSPICVGNVDVVYCMYAGVSVCDTVCVCIWLCVNMCCIFTAYSFAVVSFPNCHFDDKLSLKPWYHVIRCCGCLIG